jgi:phage terminase Nu1 subunit (DNA packaging protein)
MAEQTFLTEKELAAVLRCSVPAVRIWRKQGLPALHFGRLLRYRLADVLAWFESQHRALPSRKQPQGFGRAA